VVAHLARTGQPLGPGGRKAALNRDRPDLHVWHVWSFGGFTFYNQAAVLSSGANQLGLLVANAATAIVGN